MNDDDAIDVFAALAHRQRLSVFRLLMEAGCDGVSAGEISSQLDLAPSALSFHLAVLRRAGLIRSRRLQRRIIYAAVPEQARTLLDFLMRDCCHGHPEVCGYATDDISAGSESA